MREKIDGGGVEISARIVMERRLQSYAASCLHDFKSSCFPKLAASAIKDRTVA